MPRKHLFLLLIGLLLLAGSLFCLFFGTAWLGGSDPGLLLADGAVPASASGGTETGTIAAANAAATPEPLPPAENLLFLGDSLIANPETIAETFTARGHQVLAGHGATIPQFFGATTDYVTVGASGMGLMTGTLAETECRGVVVLLGANDISFMTAEQVMENYQALLDELNAWCAGPVIALRVFPVGPDYVYSYGESAEARNTRSEELNVLLKRFCDSTDGVYFADAAAAFTDADGYLIRDAGDGLHISMEYYDQFYAAILSALETAGVFSAS